jgi:hypothetical protein
MRETYHLSVSKSTRIFIALIHHQDIICCVAFVRSSLRRIATYASVLAPRRLASDACW